MCDLQLYEEERQNREQLQDQLGQVRRELSDLQIQLDRLHSLKSSSTSSSVSAADIGAERRVFDDSLRVS